MDESDIEALTEHLQGLGCDEKEIQRIIHRVHQYDKKTFTESVFDSIANGTFNLGAIVKEVSQDADSGALQTSDL